MSKRGFTLIELLVVIAIIAILASILFPVFAKAREKARQTQCTNNVRQLALAVNMYVQDNGSRFPGVNASTFVGWDAEIESYVGSRQIYKCPSDPASETQTPVSYGYNGLLVAPNGRGCNESQVKSPTEVGVVCDGTPTAEFGAGALIGGGALSTDLAATVNPDPRHGGVLIGYADGHAKIAPGKKIELKDISNGVSRAFYQAVGLGLIANYAGGIENTGTEVFSSYSIGGGDQVFIGGDSAGSQILLAAADIFAAQGGKVLNRGFKGFDAKGEWNRALDSNKYAWMIARSGVDTGAANSVVIGYDAMVLVVAKNCRIPKVTQNNYTLTQADIRDIFAEGYTANSVQCYTFPEYPSGVTADVFKSGSRKYFLNVVCGRADDELSGAIDVNSVAVDTDEEIIDGVSGDPFGIGYVSASVADLDRVRILKYKATDPEEKVFSFPNQNDRYATLVPFPKPETDELGDTYYPFVRPLSLLYDGSGDKMRRIIQNVDFTSGPLFETSFWANE